MIVGSLVAIAYFAWGLYLFFVNTGTYGGDNCLLINVLLGWAVIPVMCALFSETNQGDATDLLLCTLGACLLISSSLTFTVINTVYWVDPFLSNYWFVSWLFIAGCHVALEFGILILGYIAMGLYECCTCCYKECSECKECCTYWCCEEDVKV